MPVMGPNLDYARKQGEQSAEKILQILGDEYVIAKRPDLLLFPKFKEELEKNIESIREAIINISVIDAMDSF